MTYFAEFAEQLLYSALMVSLFLGGSNGLPYVPPVVNFLIKLLVVLFVFIVVTSAFYRIRQDQIVRYSWKYLLPLSVLNIALALVAVAYIPGLAAALGTTGGG